jgi:hypothetical protein
MDEERLRLRERESEGERGNESECVFLNRSTISDGDEIQFIIFGVFILNRTIVLFLQRQRAV